uniref:Conserved oligomeric Golgi complex subunit 3 n=1 Tax=Macrostomum lignano TaxID=282301 RepID=A0A1I8G8G2_9PLAT
MQASFDWDSIELSDAAVDSVFYLTSSIEDSEKDVFVPSSSERKAKDQENVSNNITELTNITEFLEWYKEYEDESDDPSDMLVRSVQAGLQKERSKWQELLQGVSDTLNSLDRLRAQYSEVAGKTNALHHDCEHLLAEQDRLLQRAQQIDTCLDYFNHYDRISAKLNSPYLQVTAESLQPVLSQIDDCLEFVNRHPEFKEAHAYHVKFKQVLARCLTLIHDSVFSVLENAVFSLESQIDQLSPENAFTLFYGRFRSHSAKVRPLMELLEDRRSRSQDYQSALHECAAAYVQHRERLLRPSVQAAVTEMTARCSTDHCSLARTGCSFLLHLCDDEESLFRQFFRSLHPLLTAMLRRLCSTFYDAFRPTVVHLQHLETLSELCHILQREAIDLAAQQQQQVQRDGGQADVQERLVYRTHVYANSEILGFRPAPGDLAYPEKLEMMRNIADSLNTGQVSAGGALADAGLAAPHPPSSVSTNMPLSPADLHGMWYPTVRRTLTLLSKLSRCLDRGTFQGLAQEVLDLCVQSLLSASKSIAGRKTSVDCDLFLMKHLLILREQVAPFQLDAGGIIKEASLDFSKMRSAAVNLFSARGRLLALNRNNAFLQFLLDSHPDVVENTLDCRQQLRATCQRFITSASERLTQGVAEFCKMYSNLEELNSNSAKQSAGNVALLRNQPWSAPEKLHDLLAEAYKRLKTQANTLQCFKSIESILEKHYTEEELQIIACPTVEQINLLLNPSRE